MSRTSRLHRASACKARHRWAALAALASAPSSPGCSEPARPWDQQGAPPAPPAASAPASAGATEPDATEPSGDVRVSEMYARCAEGLRPTDDPLRDVVRLGTSCGPSTGMQRVFDLPREGVVGDGGAALELALPLRAGRCYRIFAVGEPSIEELAVELVSSRGTSLARDRSSGRVVVLQPEGPLCAAGDDEARLVVSARRGRGRLALEAWWHEAAGAEGAPR